MASSAQRSRGGASRPQNAKGSRGRSNTKAKQEPVRTPEESAIADEIVLIGVFALTVLLFLCNFGLIGVVGDAVSRVMFGIFGQAAYAAPVLAFIAVAFGISNQGNRAAVRKLASGILLFFLIGVILELVHRGGTLPETWSVKELYETSSSAKAGGGVLSGSLAWLMYHFLGMVGTVLLLLVLTIICAVVITEKSFVNRVRTSGRYVYESARADAQVRREKSEIRREQNQAKREESLAKRQEMRDEMRSRRLERERQKQEERQRREEEQLLRMDRKVSGVMMDTSLKDAASQKEPRDDVHEITLSEEKDSRVEIRNAVPLGGAGADGQDHIRIHTAGTVQETGRVQEAQPETETVLPETAPDIEAYPDREPDITEDLVLRRSDVFSDMKEIRFGEPKRARSATGTAAAASAVQALEEPEPAEVQTDDGRPDRRPKAYLPREERPGTAALEVDPASEGRFGESAAESRRPQPSNLSGKGSASAEPRPSAGNGEQDGKAQKAAKPAPAPRPYRFPPVSLLRKADRADSGDSVDQLKETARHLQETLQTFGVRVTITDISQGPTVTRYELQPEQGVRVSKILSLADDIKLNLAAADIRIEAPILGKSAVGIEVPNKRTMAVGFRDMVESAEFREFPSKIAFAVGKDIGGKTIVSDIARMPHMLIAGSTGSGKSVCINTLIMSILYKAEPSEVKLILVDPKVVELSVYNGIPHLLIPVVTDPKKASAALQWGVAEMTDRYRKFADHNVRDLKGFNKKVEELQQKGEADVPAKLPQIVIIVDELADLMMVAPGEVEESICRLAQLARAAGIHLIIATQRPSVDVITGLIKANMPSRVAFAVSSGVDSRTILDMNGAEKLLGKGDMLFYPQGYSKPVRIQGAFISDEEVSAVVDFLKNQNIGNVYSEDVEEKMKNMGSGAGGASSGGGTQYDEYFVDAGKFIIDKDKASIGMLQRVFKIGFNRAARIMDQLAEAGVVGDEEGTKPRKVLMSMEEFEQFVEETV